jgi:hypothetical protein
VAGWQEGEVVNEVGPVREMAGWQEGEIVNEGGPVRGEEERQVAGPRVLQRNRLRY